jgi:hypothetical protein
MNKRTVVMPHAGATLSACIGYLCTQTLFWTVAGLAIWCVINIVFNVIQEMKK